MATSLGMSATQLATARNLNSRAAAYFTTSVVVMLAIAGLTYFISGYFIPSHMIERASAASCIALLVPTVAILRFFGFKSLSRYARKNSLSLIALACAAAMLAFVSIDNEGAVWLVTNSVAIATVIGGFAALLGFGFAIWSAFFNAWISLRNQRISVRILCIERYDEFAKRRPNLAATDDKGQALILAYFRRHWAIKKDQLDFWIAGYVDPEALLGWFMSDVGYFSGSSTSIPEPIFTEYWERVRVVPGSVDKRLIYVVERIQSEIVKMKCPHPNCEYRGKKACPNWQRAGLFSVLMDLEEEQQWAINSRRANGVGRETFEKLLKHSLPEDRNRINNAREQIVGIREKAAAEKAANVAKAAARRAAAARRRAAATQQPLLPDSAAAPQRHPA